MPGVFHTAGIALACLPRTNRNILLAARKRVFYFCKLRPFTQSIRFLLVIYVFLYSNKEGFSF